MKILECITAYMAITELQEQKMGFKAAYGLYDLKNRLKPHAEFFAAKEKELVNEYAARDEKGGIRFSGENAFVFANAADAGGYRSKRLELMEIEVSEEFIPIKIPAPHDIKISQLDALEKFVIFETEEE